MKIPAKVRFFLSLTGALSFLWVAPVCSADENGQTARNDTSAAQTPNAAGTEQHRNRQRDRRQQSELDQDRARLRQALQRDRANNVQRIAIQNSNAGETDAERQRRQRAYEANARLRGEEAMILQDLPANERAQAASDWAENENLTYEDLRRQRLAQHEQQRLASARSQALKSWASGETDVEEVRRQAREKTIEDRRRAQEARRENE